ncbi:MAG: hypothetical protein Q7S26_04465, partial [bacterium]|nr:hypothetical protein [bacterium]
MSTSRGFVWLPVLLAILGVLAVSGGAYWYEHIQSASKSSSPAVSQKALPRFIKSPAYAVHPAKQDWLLIGADDSVDLTGWSVRSTQSGKFFMIGTLQGATVKIEGDVSAFVHTVGSLAKSYRAENEYHIYFGQ